MEKIYYLVIDNEQAGPYSIDELKGLKINKDLLVWKEGLDDWTQAEMIEELKVLFSSIPPPIPKSKEQEVVIKTEEPLKFEDNLKKEKLTQQKIQNEKTKKKTAKEIKRAVKFFKYSLIAGLLGYVISFGIYKGFEYLTYYMECDKENIYDLEAEKKIFNVESFDKFETTDYNDFDKWAQRLDLGFKLDNWSFNTISNYKSKEMVFNYESGRMYYDRTNQSRHYSSYYDYDQRVSANYKYRYEDLNGGKVIIPEYEFRLPNDNKPQSYQYRQFEKKFKDGLIKEIREINEISIEISYGKIIKRNLDYAIEYSFYWGIGFLALVFPGFYLLSLLFIGLRNTKDWVEKNSQAN